MKIIIQAFKEDSSAHGAVWHGDCIAEIDSFIDAHQALLDMEKNGI